MHESNIDFFPWNNDFKTGINEIDEQHQALLALLNKVAHQITFDGESSQFLSLLDEFIDYAIYHFKSEEKYWFGLGGDVPEVKQHQLEHIEFKRKIESMMQQVTDELKIEELLSFLTRWLAEHILESDRWMAFFISSVQQGLSIEEAKSAADVQIKSSSHIITSELFTINSLQLLREIKFRNQALCQLYDSEKRLHEAMQYAKIGYWYLPFNSTEAHWSPEMYELLGLPIDCDSGPESLGEIMDDDYYHPFICSVEYSFQSGSEHHIEYPIIRPTDGERRWIECKGKVVYKEDGSPDRLTGFIQDITEHKETETKIERLAYYDALTQLPNRRLLLERLNHSLAAVERNQNTNALLFLDLDNFKTLNDVHGHEYGDLLLSQAAVRIVNSIRHVDTASRVGGDEFVIIIEGLNTTQLQAATDAKLIAHKILKALSKPFKVNEIQYDTSVSIGIVLFNDESHTASELMKQADIAMYQAKNSGKNTHCFFDPDMQKHMTERVSKEVELRTAIANEQLELFYQPQFNNLGAIIGAEALIRWHHPQEGMVSPMQFIPLAEETGLIVPIGDWVLSTACKQLKQWQINPITEHLTLSVNVSYKQLQQSNFIEQVAQVIKANNIIPTKLKIELTESVFAEDLQLTIDRIKQLDAMGVEVSLDDFGTGYSSLQYLKSLPLYQLKIDGSFVRDIMTDPSDKAIVKTIISMAKGLGLGVIAEGVETVEQESYLLSEGCIVFQGFLFSRPVPISQFEQLMHSRDCIQSIN